MMYHIYTKVDETGIDWYAADPRQLPLPIPARPLLLVKRKKGK